MGRPMWADRLRVNRLLADRLLADQLWADRVRARCPVAALTPVIHAGVWRL